MVFNPTSPIRSFHAKQKAAQVEKASIEKKTSVQTEEDTMATTEQKAVTPVVGAKPAEMKQEPLAEAQSAPVKTEAVRSAEEKPAIGSPAISPGFSAAETAKDDKLANVGSLGNRPGQSWAGSMKRLLRRSQETENKLSKQQPIQPSPKAAEPVAVPAPLKLRKVVSPVGLHAKSRKSSRKSSKSTTNSSPVDPAYDPVNKRFKDAKDEKVEVPAMAVTGPDEPKSFLNLDSSSDEESPVVQRASSVRVGKPHIVCHTPKSASHGKFNAEKEKLPQSPSIEKAENDKATEDERTDALAKLEGKSVEVADQHASTIALPPTPPVRADQYASTMALPPTPRAHAETEIKSTTIVISNHPDNAEKHDVFVTPIGRLSSIRRAPTVDTVNPLPTKTALDGLRSNPTRDSEKSLLSRTISAPTLPNRNPNRRVTIRPTDLVIHPADHDNSLFRDSILVTPYPSNLHSPTGDKKDDLTALPSKPASKPTVSVQPPTTGEKDRFPSPTSSDEHLFLTLTLSRHPSASTTIEITIPTTTTTTTYDDDLLFSAIRTAYHRNLLGLSRQFFNSRTLSHATPGTSDLHLDGVDFVSHLRNPKLGRGRKGWLIWLRSQQPLPKRASSIFSSGSPDTSHPPYWSPSSVPRMPFTRSAAASLPPQIRLQYRFNLQSIFIATFFVLLMSVFSTIMWVLFGYPGMHANDELTVTDFGKFGWQRDAQMRVLTGLVLGVMVMAVGGTAVGGWVAGGVVLL